MSCNFTEKVSSLIDGELAPSEAREVERHLLNCSECEQLRADFLNLRRQIASFETSLQPAVQNRALKKILSRQPLPALQWAFGTQAIAFAALLIVGAIIGLIIYKNSRAPQSQQTAAVQTPSPVPAASVEKQPTPEASPESSRGTEQPMLVVPFLVTVPVMLRVLAVFRLKRPALATVFGLRP